jgi:hypothetical protein
MTTEYFVIAITNDSDPNDKSYLYHDPDCGPLMGGSFHSAHKYTDYEMAKDMFDALLAEKPRTYSDGTIYPPDFISRGLHMSNNKTKVSGTLTIEKLVPWPMHTTRVQGEIQRPTGFTY